MQVIDVPPASGIGNIANPQLIGERLDKASLSSSSTYGNDGWNWLCPGFAAEEDQAVSTKQRGKLSRPGMNLSEEGGEHGIHSL